MNTISGAWRVLVGLVGTGAVFALWLVVIIVIPGVIALYGSQLFPLTGGWRERFRSWKQRK